MYATGSTAITTHSEWRVVREGDWCTWWVLNFTAEMVVTERGLWGWGWMANSTTAHTALVLPLEQFILNAFEKAPSRDKTTEREGEANSAKEEKREVEGEKETVKAHGQVRSLTFRTADGGE